MIDYNLERYDKVHLWLGNNFAPESDYQKYFELDYSCEGDFADPAYKVCGFCQDVGMPWYDEDFIGIIARRPEAVTLDEMLQDSAIDASEWQRVKAACAALGVVTVNAMFWYSDGDCVLSTPLKASYNSLHYIGLFEGN